MGIGGGGQVSNMVDGIIADIEGEVKSASGTKLFSVKDIEGQIKAPIFGVWSTPGGREYWDKREKKKETESVSTKNPFLPSKKAKTTVGKNPFFP